MESGNHSRCSRCGKNLPQGSVKYIMKLTITADFDGFLEEKDTGSLDTEALLSSIHEKTEEELEDEVWIERVFLLCQECRNKIVHDPLNAGDPSMEGWVT
ncbi:MAG: hypothetical protein GXP49_17585 [Deltaproteobacteria bacterium]|nr:hypothetical protein [Deltaproteobacteria bacterium]